MIDTVAIVFLVYDQRYTFPYDSLNETIMLVKKMTNVAMHCARLYQARRSRYGR